MGVVSREEVSMTGVYIMFGGMLLFATFFGVIDWLNERRDRREKANRT